MRYQLQIPCLGVIYNYANVTQSACRAARSKSLCGRLRHMMKYSPRWNDHRYWDSHYILYSTTIRTHNQAKKKKKKSVSASRLYGYAHGTVSSLTNDHSLRTGLCNSSFGILTGVLK